MTTSDIKIIEFGGNAFIYNWANIASNACGLHLPKVSVDDFRKYYKKEIREARKKGQQPVILGLPTIDTQKYFDYIAKGRNSEEILSWLGGSHVYIANIYEIYRSELRNIAEEEQVSLIEIAPQMRRESNFSELLSEDGIHLSTTGRDFARTLVSKTK